MPNCVVIGCKNQSSKNKKQDGITFHTFPTRNEYVKKKWVAVIRGSRNEPTWTPTSRSVVCSAHFNEKELYYTKKGLRRVVKSGYPKILPGIPLGIQFANLNETKPKSYVYFDLPAPEATDNPAVYPAIVYSDQPSASCDTELEPEFVPKKRKKSISTLEAQLKLCKRKLKTLYQRLRRHRISIPLLEVSTQTPEELKQATPSLSEDPKMPSGHSKPRPRRDRPGPPAGYGGVLKAATTIQEPCTVCCVFGCRNNERLNPDKAYFPLPEQPERYLNWLKLINREDLTEKLASAKTEHRVCSDHFDAHEYDAGALNEGAVPHQMLPMKIDNVKYGDCGGELEEIKIEPADETEMEVEIHFEPEILPPVTFDEPVMKEAHVEIHNASIPAISTNKNLFQPKSAEVNIENIEVPDIRINKNIFESNSVDRQTIINVKAPATYVNKSLHTKLSQIDILKMKQNYLRNASISCIEHISLPIEGPVEAVEKKSVIVQTTKALIDKMNAPLKKKYAQELREVNEKLKKLEHESNNTTMDQKKFVESCDKYLDEKIASIVKSHASLLEKSTSNRYSQNFKMFSLNLYLCSPQSYKFVEQFFYLPSITTLRRMRTPVRTGFNENLMQSLCVKVRQMSDKEKLCAVCFDYMEVNKNLYYDVKNDLVCGLHEIDQVQGSEPAQYATVIMARGLYSKWKQPVSFALAAEKKCYPEIKKWIDKTIGLLFDIGLNVKALVANQDTEFLDFADISMTESYYEVCGRKVYQIYDVPFLFKCARDDFIKYEFRFGAQVAKLSHVLEVYDADKEQELKLMPKITDQHLTPNKASENDIKLSIELFSRSVAAAMNFHVKSNMVDKEINDTVEFVQLMNNLFDILNSTKVTCENEYQKAYRGTQEQIQYLTTALEYLRQLEMVDAAGNAIQKKNFVTGLLITIKSLVNLTEDLQKENLKYILTKNLSKDCVEDYFKRVRQLAGKSYARPTSIMFSRSFKRLFLTDLVANTKKGGTEIDLKATLNKISEYVNLNIDWKKEDENQNRSLSVGVVDYQKLWPAPPTEFVAGYLLWKCFEKHKCQELIETLCRQFNMEVNADLLLEKLKKYNGNNMKKKNLLPLSSSLTNFVERLDKIFNEVSATHGVNMFGFGAFIYTKMEVETFEMPCQCFQLKVMKYLFIRMKIFHMVKAYNLQNKPIRHSRIKK